MKTTVADDPTAKYSTGDKPPIRVSARLDAPAAAARCHGSDRETVPLGARV